jgi:DNA replication initiation complex subunit (GINS family)
MPVSTVQEMIDMIDNVQIRDLLNMVYKDYAPLLAKLEEDIFKGVEQFGGSLEGSQHDEFLLHFRKEAFHTILNELLKVVATKLEERRVEKIERLSHDEV